jgi:hypothetical protein
MGELTAKRYPGTHEINDQFVAGANIRKALTDYKRIRRSNGDYTFGDLTTKYYNLSASEESTWKTDVALYPTEVQNEIKRHVIAALTHVDDQGHEKPVPLSINWDTTGSVSVTCTYNLPDPTNPTSASYTILITGLPSPLSTPFAERRGKY